MASAETVKLAEPSHYLWWFPGSPVKIHLALRVVRQLKDRILDSGSANSEEGLLFGGIRDGATEIVAFDSAATSSVPDMLGVLPTEKKASVVGYYRIENRDAFQLTPQDHLLARDHFAKPFNVFLIVHRSKFGPPTATFFFHDREGHMADFAFLEFPFDASLLASEQHDRMLRSHQAQPLALVPAPPLAEPPLSQPHPAQTPVAQPITAQPTRAQPTVPQPTIDPPPTAAPPVTATPTAEPESLTSRRWTVRTFWWICLAISIVGSGVLFNDSALRQRCFEIWKAVSGSLSSKYSSAPTSQSGAQPSVSLRAVRQNGDLALTWDRNSVWIAAASSATLSIQDGDSTRVISFDAAQLRNGSLLYVPKADQILMRMTVTTPTGNYAESVTVILPSVGEPRTYPAPSPKPMQTAVGVPPAPPASVVPATPLKAFVAPPLPKAPASPTLPVLQDPPPTNDHQNGVGLLEKAPAAIPSSVERPPSPAPPTTSRQSLQPTSAVAETYEPAVAIAKTQPRYPEELRTLLVRNISVEVRVTIDKAGKVIQAEAIPQRNVSQLLVNSVVTASRLWKFKPALRNHEPVASESILEFVFKP